VHNGEPKPRCKRKVLSGLEGVLEIVGFEVMVEGVRAGTHSEGWRERISHYMSCSTETVVVK